jgi:acyl-CoA synthetase (AMP-forming)/AMP-acid ligase II
MELVTPADHKKVLAVLPMFHITGIVHIMHFPLVINAEVIMLPAFDMESMLSTITEYQIPELLLVPPILIRLVRDPIVDKHDLRCVKRISSGAAPVSEEILQLLKEKFPGSGFKQVSILGCFLSLLACLRSKSCLISNPIVLMFRHAPKTIL